MSLDVYDLVVNILGELPLELHFLYAVGTLLIFVLILMCLFLPFIIVFKVWGD